MRLVVTIDTEEDNWGDYSPTSETLSNIGRIPVLQELFNACGVTPTYLVTYPVATDDASISILGEIEKAGKCEIGMHCHPWNTPPFEEERNEKNSMLCNLPEDLQYAKLNALHHTIKRNFGIQPLSFRSGRWGYGHAVANSLHRLGYRVDTSITSYRDWKAYHGPDFSDVPPLPFRFSRENIFAAAPDGRLVEVPATIAYLQRNFTFCNSIYKMLSKKPMSRLRLIGILDRLHLLNKVWLSPEQSDSKKMIQLAECLMKKNYGVINLFFHSTTLKAGLTEYVRTRDDEKSFLRRMKEFLTFTNDAGIESIRLSDTANFL